MATWKRSGATHPPWEKRVAEKRPIVLGRSIVLRGSIVLGRPVVRIPGRMPGACVLHASVPAFPCHVQPLWGGHGQTSEFPSTSEFPTASPTHIHHSNLEKRSVVLGERVLY